MDDEKRKILEKEIDLIQSCINRMAQNSFIVKGWTITLVTLSLLVSSETIIDIKFIGLILLVMTFCFWYLDGFFMKTEKLYRWKYEWVIKNRKCSDLSSFSWGKAFSSARHAALRPASSPSKQK